MRLEGKVALITGAGSGIGRATAILFAQEGAKVVIADCVEEGAQETVSTIKAAGGEAIFVKTDVSQSADVQNMVETTISTYGQLDILFNNAGIEQIPLATTDELPEEVWDKVTSVNLKGVFLGMKYGIPHMLDRGGAVINQASIAGVIGVSHIASYSASKGGVIQLTKTAALEYATRKVRVNCICPGYIDTPLQQRARLDRTGQKWGDKPPYRPPSPVDRRGTPEEVANVALFLASGESSYITGQAIIVDGGVTTT